MDVLGWGLFAVGALLLFFFAFVGLDAGFGNVANLAGTLTGVATMISGAVFVAGSRIENAILGSNIQSRGNQSELPKTNAALAKETSVIRGWVIAIAILAGLLTLGAIAS